MSSFDQVELTNFVNLGDKIPLNSKEKEIFNTINREIQPIRQFILHLGLLLKKNYILQTRSKKTFYLQVLSPFLVCLAIMLWQIISDEITNHVELNPPSMNIPLIPKCLDREGNNNDCSTIVYSVIVSLFILVNL